MQRKSIVFLVLSLMAHGFSANAGAQKPGVPKKTDGLNAAEESEFRDASRYSVSKFTSGSTLGELARSKPKRSSGRRKTSIEQRLKSVRRPAAERASSGSTYQETEQVPRISAVEPGRRGARPIGSADPSVPLQIPSPPVRTGLQRGLTAETRPPVSSRRTTRALTNEQLTDGFEESPAEVPSDIPATPPPVSIKAYGGGDPSETEPVRLATSPPAATQTDADEDSPARQGEIPAKRIDQIPAKPIVESNEPADDGALMSSQGAKLHVATTGPRTIVIGKEATYVVSVENTSRTPAKNVAVELSIPPGADVVRTDASSGRARFETIGEDGGRVRWTIPHVEGSSREQLDLGLIPRDSRSFDLSVNWTFAPDASIAQIEVREPKLELLLSGASDILYGESKIYTVTVRNPGTGDAENVVLNLLPISRQEAAGVHKMGTLKAGQSERIDVELTAQQPGQILIRAQAFADGGLRAEVAEEVVVRRANLEVTLVAPEVKYAGTVAQYDLRVTNTGDAVAENVVATAMLPQGAEFVKGGSEAEYDEASGRVSWALGGLRPGAVRVMKLKCVLGTPGANRLEMVAEAADDLASFQSAITVVEALADLKLMVNDPQGPVAVGENAVFEIHVMNRGSKPAQGIHVYTFFSEGIEPKEVEGGQAVIEPGQVVFDQIDRIAPGQELIFKISAQATTSGNHIFRTEVNCEDPETELAAQETTRFYGEVARTAEKTEQPGAGTDIRR